MQAGWPSPIQDMPLKIQPYWNFYNEITIEDGLLLKGPGIDYHPYKLKTRSTQANPCRPPILQLV